MSAKVLLVAELWAPAFTGAGLRFERYLPGLAKRGIAVNVLTATPSDLQAELTGTSVTWADLPDGSFMPTDSTTGARVDRVKLPGRSSWRRERLFERAIVEHVRRTEPNLVQFFGLRPTRSRILPAFHRAGVASVVCGTLGAGFSSNPVKRALQRARLRYPLQKVDRVVASSEVMRRFYEDLGVRTPVSVIPNGVDVKRFAPSGSETEKRTLRLRLGMSPDSEILVFIGSVIPRKGVDLLLEAFGRVASSRPTLELYIVGPRTDQVNSDSGTYGDLIHDLVRRSGAAERVHFTGIVAQVELYLRAADAFVFPSRREGMGNVVLEAMASGLPAILTPYDGLPTVEFGMPGKQFLLADPTADSLTGQISGLLSDVALRRSVGIQARRWVEQRMDVEVSIDMYADLYAAVASERGGSPETPAHLRNAAPE